MKDLNKCCDESKCNNCVLNGLNTLCIIACALPDAPFNYFVERVRSELYVLDNILNKLDEEVKE